MKRLIFLVVVNIIIFFALDFVQNEILQKQNLLNINSVRYCLIKTKGSLVDKLNVCAKNQRNLSETGDMFVLNPKTKYIIWDASVDCKMDKNKSYLKEGYVCDLFYNKQSCINLSNKMGKYNDGEGQWYFNDNPELVYFRRYKDNNITYTIASGGEKRDIINIMLPIYILIIIIDIIMLFSFRKKDDQKI